MNHNRYTQIDRDGYGLTKEELEEGWHFCPEWDEMLIGPPMKAEMEACLCSRQLKSAD